MMSRSFLQKNLYWIFLFAHGCVAIPSLELATSRDSLGCGQTIEKAIDSGIVAYGTELSREWWKEFEDTTLNSLIERAIETSPTMQKAEAKLKKAFEIAMEKRSSLFPRVDFNVTDAWAHLSRYGILRGFAPTVYPMMINDTILGLSFVYEFDFWGKNRDLFKAALGESEAVAAEKLQAELILTTSLAYTYSELQLLMNKRNIAIKMEINQREIESIRAKREKSGIDSSLTTLQARSDYLERRAKILQIEEEIETHINKLKALAGMGQDEELEIHCRPISQNLFKIPEDLSINLIGRRPDLIAQRRRVEAAARKIGAAKSNFYPKISLQTFVGLASVFWDQFFSKESYFGLLEPALNLPIFTGGQIRANLKEKGEEFNEAVSAYNEMIVNAAKEIADILVHMSRLQKELNLRENSFAIARKQSEITLKRFENALDDRQMVLRAQNDALNSEMALVELAAGTQLAGIDLIRSIGGGCHE